MTALIPLLISLAAASWSQADPWHQAELNARQSREALHLARRNTFAWLAHADPRSGLLPRTLRGDDFWNARDCAADNYPFILLTGYMTDDYHLKRTAQHILAQEQKLANRLDSMPDDVLFATQKFRTDRADPRSIIFGAAEYAKDGLIPVTEWLGPSPWLERMKGLIDDVWKHAPVDAPAGRIPSEVIEVNGDLLQTMGRLYWLTGDGKYKQWSYRLADHYLFHAALLDNDSVHLRDHGCEIIGGLSEAYVLAAVEDPPQRERYRPRLYALLDDIQKHGLNPDAQMFVAYNPKTGRPTTQVLSDGWGYVYNAFVTVALIDDQPRFLEAPRRAMANVHRYGGMGAWGNGADQLADSIEGCINLLNRLPEPSAAAWIDKAMTELFAAQKPDGTIEGWYGDGNTTRTALMYALWKTQGLTAAPWPEELQIGAVREADGTLRAWIRSDYAWSGHLRFDRPRHRDFFHMPLDYPRINQFPEWFTVDRVASYTVQHGDDAPKTVRGNDLLRYPLSIKAGQALRLTVKPAETKVASRTRRYTSRSRDEAAAWQRELRGRFFELLKLEDLRAADVPLDAKVGDARDRGDYVLSELTLRSTPGRMIPAVLAVPKNRSGPLPAVVCIHGHGGNRHVVYDDKSIYRGFADALARRGVITISTEVGQHEVYETGRTLMGERLWDLMRCVDYLHNRPDVDKKRIGCAGLSLGGEMAMWLGAMDERVAATVSSGYLTTMDQMELDHCLCWKFDGLRELVDWADVYAMIAPRALQCQNGLAEAPHMFVVPLARRAMKEIRLAYQDFGATDRLELAVHPEGHVIDLPALLAFFDRQFK
ncbi:MAG: acetylxylan esterase [Phycisphaerae bacterium]